MAKECIKSPFHVFREDCDARDEIAKGPSIKDGVNISREDRALIIAFLWKRVMGTANAWMVDVLAKGTREI
jgi:hypothetical protein